VLREGAGDSFEGHGVEDPEVIWDAHRKLYRMWYLGRTLIGETNLGYAVSTDGVRWHKWPGNPVVRPGDFGLEEIGSPAVLVEDGDLRMFFDGHEPNSQRLSIYSVINRGQPPM